MLNTLLLTLALVTGPGEIRYRDYPWMGMRNLSDISKIDGIAIVRAGRRIGESVRQPSLRGARPETMMVDEVEVVDSPAFSKGTRLHIVAPTTPKSKNGSGPSFGPGGGQLYSLGPGQLYLLISIKGRGGELRFPDSHDGLSEYMLIVPQKDPSEVAGLSVFHTQQTKLPKAPTPGEQLVLALVDCLDGANPDDALRTAPFLKTMRPPEFGAMETSSAYAATPLTRRMRAMADKAEPYVGAKILQVLMNWHILGTEGAFVRAVAAAGREKSAFCDPRDELSVDLGFGGSVRGYQPDLPTGDWCARAITEARSPTVQYFFAGHMFGPLDAALLKDFVRTMENSSGILQDVLLDQLARRAGEKGFEPKYGIVNGRREMTNRSALIHHWKNRASPGN